MERYEPVAPRSGIYAIVNRITGDMYIGSASDLDARYRKHRDGLRRGDHSNVNLRAAAARDGIDAFYFVELLLVRGDPKDLEAKLLKDIVGRPGFYNIADQIDVTFRGRKHTPETIAKMAESRRKWHERKKQI